MRRPGAASAAIIFCMALGGMSAFAQEPPTGMGGGTGVLSVTVVDFPWEQSSGKELHGWVEAPSPDVFMPVEGTISATIPGPSAQPGGVTRAPSGNVSTWSSSVTAQLQLDGQPVHLEPGRYWLVLTLGEPGCSEGWITCDWSCGTVIDLRSDEDIWMEVEYRVESQPVTPGTCLVGLVAHRPPAVSPSEQ